MKSRSKWGIAAILVVLVLGFAGCNVDDALKTGIVGEWSAEMQDNKAQVISTSYVFKDDNTFEKRTAYELNSSNASVLAGEYKISGGMLGLMYKTRSGEALENPYWDKYAISIKSDKMILVSQQDPNEISVEYSKKEDWSKFGETEDGAKEESKEEE